jgi:MFS family permease
MIYHIRPPGPAGAIVEPMTLSLPDAATWETQCFISAAVVGVTVIAVISGSLAQRGGLRSRRRLLLTVLVAVGFVAVLALVFASVDPCAQGPS